MGSALSILALLRRLKAPLVKRNPSHQSSVFASGSWSSSTKSEAGVPSKSVGNCAEGAERPERQALQHSCKGIVSRLGSTIEDVDTVGGKDELRDGLTRGLFVDGREFGLRTGCWCLSTRHGGRVQSVEFAWRTGLGDVFLLNLGQYKNY